MLDLKYKSAIVYSNPRCASSFFCKKLSEIHSMKYTGEILGDWRTFEDLKKYLNENNSLCKIQGEQYHYYSKIFEAYALNKNKSIIILKPRDILPSYSSYILPSYMTQQNKKQRRNWGHYWNVGSIKYNADKNKHAVYSSEDLRNLYNNVMVPYDDAINIANNFTQTTKYWWQNLDYFMSASDDVHIVTQEDINGWKENDHKTVIWDSIDQKINHIEDWDKVQEHIINTGEKLWKKIELCI